MHSTRPLLIFFSLSVGEQRDIFRTLDRSLPLCCRRLSSVPKTCRASEHALQLNHFIVMGLRWRQYYDQCPGLFTSSSPPPPRDGPKPLMMMSSGATLQIPSTHSGKGKAIGKRATLVSSQPCVVRVGCLGHVFAFRPPTILGQGSTICRTLHVE
jgi:hypothetical protein